MSNVTTFLLFQRETYCRINVGKRKCNPNLRANFCKQLCRISFCFENFMTFEAQIQISKSAIGICKMHLCCLKVIFSNFNQNALAKICLQIWAQKGNQIVHLACTFDSAGGDLHPA